MKKIFLLLLFILLVCASGLFFIFNPPSTNIEKTVDIPPGASVRSISKLLENEGVLEHAWTLVLLSKISGQSNRIQSGEFMFHVPSSPKNVFEILLHGTVVLHKVTIPEGSTVKEMAPWFEESKIISGEEFLNSFKDISLLQSFNISSDSFEGYLFPSTYLFPKHEKIKKIFKVMNDELKKNINSEDQTKAEAFGWSLHQWITFASVIEKETGNPDEYPLVSSVFHNRLKSGMKLQSDPTVIYGIPNYDGNIRKTDLQTDTPYNTYTRTGIPIGPICNPGVGAIHAAVNPADTEYFYFVGNGQGKHIFSKTYQEHLIAVKKYQLNQQ